MNPLATKTRRYSFRECAILLLGVLPILVGFKSADTPALLPPNSSTAQATGVIINEIYPPETIELKNCSTYPVNVSSWLLCNYPGYKSIGSTEIICGSYKEDQIGASCNDGNAETIEDIYVYGSTTQTYRLQ